MLVEELADVPSKAPFSQIDRICFVLSNVATQASDDAVAANALLAGMEVAYDWDRWNAQGIMRGAVDILISNRPAVVDDALSRVNPLAAQWVMSGEMDP